MADGFNRYIGISSGNLGKDTKLLFIFDVLAATGGSAYKTYFPTVWKIFDFPAEGYSTQNLSYKNEPAWILPTIQNRIVTDTSKYVVVPVGQQTNIISNCGDPTFTPPTTYPDPTITQANNSTWTCQDVDLGFIPPRGGNPVYVCHFVDVASGSEAKAAIGHNCRAYIVNGYDFKEGQIITKPIWSYITPLWQESLGKLGESTFLYLDYDNHAQKYSLSTSRSVERVKEISMGVSGKELKQQEREKEVAKHH